jgi:hypothetical protein
MNILNRAQAVGRVKIDGVTSATGIVGAAGSKFVLQEFTLGWSNMTSSCTVCLMERDTATTSGTFLQFVIHGSSTGGMNSMYFGEIGIPASQTGTSLYMTTGIAGTYCGFFSGYLTG